ncbi:MAG TPA: RNA polymerase sigma factor, partial [Chitinophagaceae bacterium]|nr:RNA polymerase sigma factor [Chitinophagaceae bacterium]
MRILDTVTETALVKECIAGNRSMQNRLYNLYASGMMGVCMRYAKCRQDAEEILQEGFIKVFTCLHQYKFKSCLEAWIRKIIINCALQKLRERQALYPVLNIDDVAEHYNFNFT